MSKKKIPVRKTQIAEEYARKVRVEPPKATRQEVETADGAEYEGVPGQHDHGPQQKPKNRKP